eukprot:190758-Amorphochlora_amoeboformis.AAC.3
MLSRTLSVPALGLRNQIRRLSIQVGLPASKENIDQVFKHDAIAIPAFNFKDNTPGVPNKLHEKKAWSKDEIDEKLKENCVFAWGTLLNGD